MNGYQRRLDQIASRMEAPTCEQPCLKCVLASGYLGAPPLVSELCDGKPLTRLREVLSKRVSTNGECYAKETH